MDDLRRYDTPGGDRVLAYGEHKMVCARSGGPTRAVSSTIFNDS